MDAFSSLIVALVLSLGITYLYLRTEATEENDSRNVDQLASNTISALLIMVYFYTNDIVLFAMMLIICLPITVYGFYKQYKADKKRLIYSSALLAGIMVIIWSTTLI